MGTARSRCFDPECSSSWPATPLRTANSVPRRDVVRRRPDTVIGDWHRPRSAIVDFAPIFSTNENHGLDRNPDLYTVQPGMHVERERR